MSPEARALAAVESTEAWKGWSNPTNIGAAPDAQKYIENRLRAAFLLGFQEGTKCAADRMRDFALGKNPN